MHSKRTKSSLSGLPSLLIALGGQSVENLKTCERYLVGANKWSGLPPLNEARMLPGSLLLKSLEAFCFCGGLAPQNFINRIEKMRVECEANWRTLPLDSRIAKTYHIAGVSFRSKIMLFGGVSSASYNMYALMRKGSWWMTSPKTH